MQESKSFRIYKPCFQETNFRKLAGARGAVSARWGTSRYARKPFVTILAARGTKFSSTHFTGSSHGASPPPPGNGGLLDALSCVCTPRRFLFLFLLPLGSAPPLYPSPFQLISPALAPAPLQGSNQGIHSVLRALYPLKCPCRATNLLNIPIRPPGAQPATACVNDIPSAVAACTCTCMPKHHLPPFANV